MSTPIQYSIITTCKNRLSFLKESLPSFMAQADAETIVVDYDCPEGTQEYVNDNWPDAIVVKIPDRPKFSLCEARNAGAARAQGSVLIFADADVSLAPNFTTALNLPPDGFGSFTFANDVRGTCVVPKNLFETVGGYDEVIVGYSQEDLEFYTRLKLAGYTHEVLPEALIAGYQKHSNDERVKFYDMGRKLSYARGKIYRDAKHAILRLAGQLEAERPVREAIWDQVTQMLMSPDLFTETLYLDIPLPIPDAKHYLPNCEFGASIRMSIRLRK